jgi:hypothetical protein
MPPFSIVYANKTSLLNVTQGRKIFSSCHADFIGELGALKRGIGKYVYSAQSAEPATLLHSPECTVKKKLIVIKSNGQCKQASAMNTLSKKALLGWIEKCITSE